MVDFNALSKTHAFTSICGLGHNEKLTQHSGILKYSHSFKNLKELVGVKLKATFIKVILIIFMMANIHILPF